jgi:hypothetical protein
VYVVVETDPAANESHVLVPRTTMAQIHATLESAERHRDWYVEHIYVEDPALGRAQVRIYRLQPVQQNVAR